MELPQGVPDLIFLCELSLELKMTVAELCHGRGTQMSMHELAVIWPAYFRYRQRVLEREAEKQRMKAERRF
jgi:hypothetical protein